MKHAILAVAATFVLGVVSVVSTVPSPAFSQTAASEAAVQTAIFNIDNMTCALCGITVKTALQGVEAAEVQNSASTLLGICWVVAETPRRVSVPGQ